MSDDQGAPAPGKIRVDHVTIDKLNDDQKSALKQANMERTTRGLPKWLIHDYVRAHPGRFPDVDHELDHAEHSAWVAQAGEPPANRVDQRPAR